MTTQMIVRINPELKNKVYKLAKSEGKNVSEVVRELLENYMGITIVNPKKFLANHRKQRSNIEH
ncbi:MAG: ribbon-helix-helix domain-containing protein [Deltaproteobacteria bacterium]|nr:ribbon-helix-helix domain-containing protein [Deltaproteobacteria bacterium]